MFFSPKHIFFGLTGTGLVGGSVAAWQLTKNDNLESLNTTTETSDQEFERRLKHECGDESFWYTRDPNEKNDKDKDYYKFSYCKVGLLQILQKNKKSN